MASATIQIELPVRSLELIRSLAPERMLKAVAKGMDLATQQTAADIQRKRLTGQGPFPVSEGRLGVRSGRLRQSVRTVKAAVVGGTVTSAIGSNVAYAGIHEFGGTIQRTVKAGVVRLRTDRHGGLFKPTFAKDRHKLVREVPFAGGKQYEIKIPARAPFGHGVADNEAVFQRLITEAVTAELGGTP